LLTITPLSRKRIVYQGQVRYDMHYDWRSPNFLGSFTRGWTPRLDGRLLSVGVEDGHLILLADLVSMPKEEEYNKKHGFVHTPALLDRGEMDLLYFLQSTFSSIRSTIFHVSVTVRVVFYDGLGQVYDEICTAKTIVEYPMWFKCSNATRLRYFRNELPTTQGSMITLEDNWKGANRRFATRGEVLKSGKVQKRRFRKRPTLPKRQEAPDLFWTTAYAIWGAFDRCIGKLQGRGQTYLSRMPLMNFELDDITVIQRQG